LIYKVNQDDPIERADLFIAARCGITRSQAGKIIKEGHASIDGGKLKASQGLHAGEEIEVNIPEPDFITLEAEDIPIDILYSDEHIVVVNKSPNLVVYPAAGHPNGTLMNALKFRFGRLAAIGGPLRPGVVHRLDKDTSGTIVVALTNEAYYNLVEQFKKRTASRSYVALVNGKPNQKEGDIDMPIGRSPHDRKKMSTKGTDGRDALTHYKVLSEFPGASLIEARLSTGRTHQIRVHLISIGHSVLGDRTYGRKVRVDYKGKAVKFPRQMLHAKTLSFEHPITGEHMDFVAPLPEDMENAIKALGAL
jgi:23S rRNA pseudouridine1911/1915/1917 synthase